MLTPYYDQDGITIYHGDCLEVLPQCSGVNLTFTSPPYNQNIQAFKPSGMHAETAWVKRASSAYHDTMPEGAYQRWQVEVLNACYDVSADDGALFYNHKVRWRDTVPISPVEWLLRCRWIMRQEIIWARDGSVTQNARMFPPSEERIYWMRKHHWKWYRADKKWLSVWRINSEPGTAHPLSFPLLLPSRAISCVTDPDDTVLDPFMGSGTTLRAAKDLGRKAIGIEIEERYCEMAAARMAQGVLQFVGGA